MKDWIHGLHLKKFGTVLGERPLQPYDPEDARRFEEQMYWDDYHERNKDAGPARPKERVVVDPSLIVLDVTDDDVPF